MNNLLQVHKQFIWTVLKKKEEIRHFCAILQVVKNNKDATNEYLDSIHVDNHLS